jgi:iron complex outermembrane receptor protein
MSLYKITNLFFLVSFLFFNSISLGAQESEDSRAAIEELVVTSQKRTQGTDAQDTGIAITVISADKIEAMGALETRDLGVIIPNAQFREVNTFPGYERLGIRGLYTTGSIPSLDPAVGTIVDGVYIGQRGGGILNLFDTESVEILRGPQGTVLGRNFTAGAIVMRSKRPSQESYGKFELGFGEYGRKHIALTLNGSLTDKIAGRIAVYANDYDGYINDLNNGGTVGYKEEIIIRPSIKYTSENFDITLIYEHYERDGDGGSTSALGLASEENYTNSIHPLSTGYGWYDTFRDNTPFPSIGLDERDRITLESNWTLDSGVITFIASAGELQKISGTDFDGATNLALDVQNHTRVEHEQSSFELRFASNKGEKFDFVAGINIFNQEVLSLEQRYGNGGQPAKYGYPDGNPRRPGFEDVGGVQVGMLEHDTIGIFGEGTFHLTNKTDIIAGIRWSEEEKDGKLAMVNVGSCWLDNPFGGDGWEGSFTSGYTCYSTEKTPTAGLPNNRIFDVENVLKVDDISYKLTVEHRPNDNLLYYATLSTGFKSGGFNFRASTNDLLYSENPGVFDPEEVQNTEVGFKYDSDNGRLRINATYFVMDIKDLVRTYHSGITGDNASGAAGAGDSYQALRNLPKSEAKGFEIEITAVLAENTFIDGDYLALNANIGDLDTSYKSLIDFDGDGTDDKSAKWQGVADKSLSLALTYERPVSTGYLTGRLSYRKIPELQYGNTPGLFDYPEFELVDGSLRYKGDNGWYASLWGKNLTDEEYTEVHVAFSSNWGIRYASPPREVGLTVGKEF